jgi:hypothetical protein
VTVPSAVTQRHEEGRFPSSTLAVLCDSKRTLTDGNCSMDLELIYIIMRQSLAPCYAMSSALAMKIMRRFTICRRSVLTDVRSDTYCRLLPDRTHRRHRRHHLPPVIPSSSGSIVFAQQPTLNTSSLLRELYPAR